MNSFTIKLNQAQIQADCDRYDVSNSEDLTMQALYDAFCVGEISLPEDLEGKVYHLKCEVLGFVGFLKANLKELKINPGAQGFGASLDQFYSFEITKEGEDLSESELKERWLQILNEMLFPFQYYSDSEIVKGLSIGEIEERKTRGLTHFAEYFEHLWD